MVLDMRMPVVCLLLFSFSALSCKGTATLESIEPPPPPPLTSASSGMPASGQPPPPETSHPVASPEARAVLGELKGRSFTDREGVFGGGEWTVGSFSVTHYPGETWRKGPHVSLTHGATSRHLPMESDGDVADLYRRVTGEPHPTLDAEMSEAYKAAIMR